MSIKGNWRRHGSEVVIRWYQRFFSRRFATCHRGFATQFCRPQREKKPRAPGYVYGGSVVQILTKTNHHSTRFTKELRAAVAVAVPAPTPQPLTFMTLNSLETSNANDSTVLSTAVVLFQCQTALVVKPSLIAGLSRLHV